MSGSIALTMLAEWYDAQRPTAEREAERYVVCAGFAVLERLKETFPLQRADYVTPKNQVKTSGRFIQGLIEARLGPSPMYASEGGRTTRGTVPAAEALATRLNALAGVAALPAEERIALAAALQDWLIDKVRDFYDRQHLAPAVDLRLSAPQIVTVILDEAQRRNNAGAVAQHLVGAKLALHFPAMAIENHAATTADRQLNRPGDFAINDTAFHVTVAPGERVIQRCEDNLRGGYRPRLLVRGSRLAAARQLAELRDLHTRIGITAIEEFVAQNIEELGAFGNEAIARGFRHLFERYNERVRAVETNLAILIDIPVNLGRGV